MPAHCTVRGSLQEMAQACLFKPISNFSPFLANALTINSSLKFPKRCVSIVYTRRLLLRENSSALFCFFSDRPFKSQCSYHIPRKHPGDSSSGCPLPVLLSHLIHSVCLNPQGFHLLEAKAVTFISYPRTQQDVWQR